MANLANLAIKVTADTSDVKVAFAQLDATFNQFNTTFNQFNIALQNTTNNTTRGFASIGASAVAMGNLMSSAFKSLLGSLSSLWGWFKGKDGPLELSARYNGAMVGLINVSRAFGVSSDAAMAAARTLAGDGL